MSTGMGSAPPLALRCMELFTGSGALAAGFREAGLLFDLVYDYSADACASYAANLGHAPTQIDVHELLRLAREGWTPGPLDLLCADPPCAMWSRAGKKKGLDDSRDMLRPTVDLIAMLRPRVALIGNIPGLEDSPNLPVVQDLIGGLGRHGYVVDFAVVDAVTLGVPQFRRRPFWYLRATGTPPIRWPEATHGDPRALAQGSLAGFAPLLPWVTCRDALGHLPVEQIGRPVNMRKRACKGKQHGSLMDRPARVVGTTNLSDGNVILDHPDATTLRPKRDPSTRGPQSARIGDPDAPARTMDGKIARLGAGAAAVLDWPWSRPSTTVLTRDVLLPPGHHPAGSRQMPNAIVLSELAAKILQGLGADWTLAGKTKRARWGMLGQAVPIKMAAAIGRSVLHQLRSSK